jgi:hypothetical protein
MGHKSVNPGFFFLKIGSLQSPDRLLKAPELQRLSVTVEVLRVGVMIVGVISVGVMTVGVLSVGVMTLSQSKILFHVDLIKMLSLISLPVSSIPVIFSSKFRIAKIHGLPFQVIKSSHS